MMQWLLAIGAIVFALVVAGVYYKDQTRPNPGPFYNSAVDYCAHANPEKGWHEWPARKAGDAYRCYTADDPLGDGL
jgi:hypothetical protein